MARSSGSDPIEKFRFSVAVITIDLSLAGAVETVAGGLATLAAGGAVRDIGKSFAVLSRAGFSEVVLPRATVSEISYRENIDNQRFSKGPGLVKYEPVTLRRGVTGNMDLYNWYRLVNDDTALQAAAQELSRDSSKSPTQSEQFRKEVVINVHDRAGNPVKQWILFNAWPSSYKGGDDLNAQSEGKLVEELTLTYEYFLELEGGTDVITKQIARDALNGLVSSSNSIFGRPPALPFKR